MPQTKRFKRKEKKRKKKTDVFVLAFEQAVALYFDVGQRNDAAELR
jgi:hypothetical protein